ncbi:hypothetical protein GM3708_1483 [Geminocystis sp. NIES-3708]|nr:hypothetical protein [Geminocystis sp. NIES-3708]BAQ61077.1 hypothetical protein GM3708_1483 [Geminocystis sp. NIES-3708]
MCISPVRIIHESSVTHFSFNFTLEKKIDEDETGEQIDKWENF